MDGWYSPIALPSRVIVPWQQLYATATLLGVAQEGVINGYINTPRMYGVNLRKPF